MTQWIRFWLTAALLVMGLAGFIAAVVGVWRFGFVMNRMHASGIGDTFALLAVTLAIIIASGSVLDMLKLALPVVFMWFTSPVSTHYLGQVEYLTNKELARFVRTGKEGKHGAD